MLLHWYGIGHMHVQAYWCSRGTFCLALCIERGNILDVPVSLYYFAAQALSEPFFIDS